MYAGVPPETVTPTLASSKLKHEGVANTEVDNDNTSGSSMSKNVKGEDPKIVHPVASSTKTLYAP